MAQPLKAKLITKNKSSRNVAFLIISLIHKCSFKFWYFVNNKHNDIATGKTVFHFLLSYLEAPIAFWKTMSCKEIPEQRILNKESVFSVQETHDSPKCRVSSVCHGISVLRIVTIIGWKAEMYLWVRHFGNHDNEDQYSIFIALYGNLGEVLFGLLWSMITSWCGTGNIHTLLLSTWH